MKVQEMKRKVQLQEWAAQIKERERSGLSVRQWCEKNGVAKKTYYNRLKRVREEFLEEMESANTACPSVSEGLAIVSKPAPLDARRSVMTAENDRPVFAALPMPQTEGRAAAVTVWMGRYTVDIQSGADGAVVEQVLKVVSQL